MSIIVYSTPTCPYCHMVKQFLDEKGIVYQDVDVSADSEKAQEMIDKSGQMGVPVVDIGGKIIVGFDKAAIEGALGDAGAQGKTEETTEAPAEEEEPAEEVSEELSEVAKEPAESEEPEEVKSQSKEEQ